MDKDDAAPSSRRTWARRATAGSIFTIIRDQGPLAASDIVRMTGLAKSTVSVYVERLLVAGLIREEARARRQAPQAQGRRIAGFVVGSTSARPTSRGALRPRGGRPRSRPGPGRPPPRDPRGRALAGSAALAASSLSRRRAGPRRLLFGIGVGLPGPVDYAHGVPVTPPVMPGWDRFPVASVLRRRVHLPGLRGQRRERHGAGRARQGAPPRTPRLHLRQDRAPASAPGSWSTAASTAGPRARRATSATSASTATTPSATAATGAASRRWPAATGSRTMAERDGPRRGRARFLAQRAARGEPLDPAALALGAAAGDEDCLRLLIDSRQDARRRARQAGELLQPVAHRGRRRGGAAWGSATSPPSGNPSTGARPRSPRPTSSSSGRPWARRRRHRRRHPRPRRDPLPPERLPDGARCGLGERAAGSGRKARATPRTRAAPRRKAPARVR